MLLWVFLFCALSCGSSVSDEEIIADAELHVEHIKSILYKVRRWFLW